MFLCNHLWLLKPEVDLSELSISFCVWDFNLSSEHINVELLCFVVLFFMSMNAKKNEPRMAATTLSDQNTITTNNNNNNTKEPSCSKRRNIWGIRGFVTIAICFSFLNFYSLLSITIHPRTLDPVIRISKCKWK